MTPSNQLGLAVWWVVFMALYVNEIQDRHGVEVPAATDLLSAAIIPFFIASILGAAAFNSDIIRERTKSPRRSGGSMRSSVDDGTQ